MKVTFSVPGAAKTGAALVISNSGEEHAYHSDMVKAAAKGANFHGKSGDAFNTYVESGVRLFMSGRGEADVFDYEMAAAKTAKSLRGSGVEQLTIHLDGTDATADDAARAALGARLAAYIWDKHKSKATKSKKNPLKSIVVVSEDPKAAEAAYENFYGPAGEEKRSCLEILWCPCPDKLSKSRTLTRKAAWFWPMRCITRLKNISLPR